MNFGFERPLLAAAAFIVIPIYLYIAAKLKNPFAVSIPLGAPGGVPFKAPHNLSGLVKFLKVIECLGVFLLFLSAAGPAVKTTEVVWRHRGADILFVIDISPSMAALDMDGKNRFNTARELIIDFGEKRPGDCIGLVAVGNDAALLLPPTADREALHTRLEQLRIGELGDGTALGMGLAVAAFHLEKSAAPRRVTVLITDGENNAGAIHPETAAAMLRDMGISFWVIGVGSGGEVPIDYVDPFTKMRRTGIFDSHFDTGALRSLSFSGGGEYIPAQSKEAFAAAFAGIDDREMIIRRSITHSRNSSVVFQFLICAFALIAAARFIRRFLLGAWL
jgi:Ca-activated chloride channel family protein